jgi:hypothetical protein
MDIAEEAHIWATSPLKKPNRVGVIWIHSILTEGATIKCHCLSHLTHLQILITLFCLPLNLFTMQVSNRYIFVFNCLFYYSLTYTENQNTMHGLTYKNYRNKKILLWHAYYKIKKMFLPKYWLNLTLLRTGARPFYVYLSILWARPSSSQAEKSSVILGRKGPVYDCPTGQVGPHFWARSGLGTNHSCIL